MSVTDCSFVWYQNKRMINTFGRERCASQSKFGILNHTQRANIFVIFVNNKFANLSANKNAAFAHFLASNIVAFALYSANKNAAFALFLANGKARNCSLQKWTRACVTMELRSSAKKVVSMTDVHFCVGGLPSWKRKCTTSLSLEKCKWKKS